MSPSPQPAPAPPITSLDDPRVPERVRWAVERLAVRVLARLAREENEALKVRIAALEAKLGGSAG